MTGDKIRQLLRFALLSLAAITCDSWASDNHELDFSSRLRAAHVDEAENHGKAASALLRLKLDSSWTEHWSSLVEVDHVETTFQDEHSDGLHLNDRPLIPDVPGTEINQLLLRYELPDASFALGRQRIGYDDERFVGSSGFWQNDQTFDAITGTTTIFTASRFDYAYIANANRIFGDRADEQLSGHHYGSPEQRPAGLLGDHRHNTHLLRAEFNEWDYSQVIGYGYLIDNRDLPEASNNTLGAKYRFNYHSGSMRYRVEVEAAVQEQTEIADSPRPGYGLVELTAGRGSFEGLLRHEYLGSSKNRGFTTPLGSGYRFQGFTDQFISTPENGIADTSLGFNWRSRPWRIQSRYHQFREASGSERYGSEFNIDITFRPVREHSLMLRYADFRADADFAQRFPDRQVVYLDYSYNL